MEPGPQSTYKWVIWGFQIVCGDLSTGIIKLSKGQKEIIG
jgi:hypothetical protein